ncbi:hypothetical protein B484DRAFT_451609 [Ochromonadaceae sp. CCMP2298]|nr:hypothetical protein B484DRAFT_451609 [Ochromonadaceae sp. CCMP2298]
MILSTLVLRLARDFLGSSCDLQLRVLSKACNESMLEIPLVESKVEDYLSSVALFVWARNSMRMTMDFELYGRCRNRYNSFRLRFELGAFERLHDCVHKYRDQWPDSSGEQFLTNIICEGMTNCEQASRKVVTRKDVEQALDPRTRYSLHGEEFSLHRDVRGGQTAETLKLALVDPYSVAFTRLVRCVTQDYRTDVQCTRSAVRRLREHILNYRDQWPDSSGEDFLGNVICDALHYGQHGCRKDVRIYDIDHALDVSNRTQYAFEG